MNAVRIARAAVAAIRESAARAYPHEGCGALLGLRDEITRAVSLPNSEPDRPRTRFTVSPADYIAVEEQADAQGLRLLGFWHSHPDHPAQPSPTDRRFAWEGLLTLVVAVDRGRPAALTAWEIPGPDDPYRELALLELEEEARCPSP